MCVWGGGVFGLCMFSYEMNIIFRTRSAVSFNMSCAPNLKMVEMKQTVTNDNRFNCYGNFLSDLESERGF